MLYNYCLFALYKVPYVRYSIALRRHSCTSVATTALGNFIDCCSALLRESRVLFKSLKLKLYLSFF